MYPYSRTIPSNSAYSDRPGFEHKPQPGESGHWLRSPRLLPSNPERAIPSVEIDVQAGTRSQKSNELQSPNIFFYNEVAGPRIIELEDGPATPVPKRPRVTDYIPPTDTVHYPSYAAEQTHKPVATPFRRDIQPPHYGQPLESGADDASNASSHGWSLRPRQVERVPVHAEPQYALTDYSRYNSLHQRPEIMPRPHGQFSSSAGVYSGTKPPTFSSSERSRSQMNQASLAVEDSHSSASGHHKPFDRINRLEAIDSPRYMASALEVANGCSRTKNVDQASIPQEIPLRRKLYDNRLESFHDSSNMANLSQPLAIERKGGFSELDLGPQFRSQTYDYRSALPRPSDTIDLTVPRERHLHSTHPPSRHNERPYNNLDQNNPARHIVISERDPFYIRSSPPLEEWYAAKQSH